MSREYLNDWELYKAEEEAAERAELDLAQCEYELEMECATAGEASDSV